ncbi:hypothetical protein BDA96_04G121100 [Sorghum bicolor]|uniref:Uncharacterized protein n=1 Tax=Sorghum bicolor TaxID=4558 RepID=A0A921UI88_SORBI|nr:hypothetical protein BDA96_04G121100 [Sorghum bicolor]
MTDILFVRRNLLIQHSPARLKRVILRVSPRTPHFASRRIKIICMCLGDFTFELKKIQ